MSLFKKENFLFVAFLFAVICLGFLGYGYFKLWQYKAFLETEVSRTEANSASIEQLFQKNIIALSEENTALKQERDALWEERNVLREGLTNEKGRMDYFSAQISSASDAINLLDKFVKTDPELLKKYSKVYFLNENYTPPRLAIIDEQYVFEPANEKQIHAQVWPFLQELLEDADRAGTGLLVISAYRSFGTQTDLKSSYSVIYGTGANTFSADQGYSEHQLGTTVDFTTSELGESSLSFKETPAYRWLMNNAYKYGFVISYPEENTYYQFEPWHWRFVGRGLAGQLHAENKYFYEEDQREIDIYRVSFFN